MDLTTSATWRRLAFAAIGVLVAGCGGGSNEDGLEKLIEQQTGDSVELDLSGGGINVESDDGSFTLDDDGNFTAVGADGQVVTGDVNEDGGIKVSGDDGSTSFQTSAGIPDDWPAEVPQPEGLDVQSGATYTVDGMLTVTVAGSIDSDLSSFAAAYAATLQAAGFAQTSFYEATGAVSAFYENGTWEVSVGGGDGADGPLVTIVVAAAAS